MPSSQLKQNFERLYNRYHRRRYVHPDPLEFLYQYDDKRDREVVGLIASSLAYGRVAQILKSLSIVFHVMGKSPYSFIRKSTYNSFCRDFQGFKHRFAKEAHMASMLFGIKVTLNRYDSLNNCFVKGMSAEDNTVISGIKFLVKNLSGHVYDAGHLIPNPEKKSACKRLNLFLRWMIRKDRVDPGGWEEVSTSKLIIPLDIHMFKISQKLGLTKRNQANMKTALDITSFFRKLVPDDPVKYDFVLTRLGIRTEMSFDDFYQK